MFCRNCGKDIPGNPKVCANCGSSPIKGTSFCRYCGGSTTEQDAACPKCEAALKVTGEASKALSPKVKKWLIALAVVFVIVYGVLATPARIIIKPLQSAVASMVLSATGYSGNPLSSISADPVQIPVLLYDDRANLISHFSPGETEKLTIAAKYTKDISVSSGASKDVTKNCVFKSNDDQIATVSPTGLVRAVAPGSTFITVTYTAIPGSADWSTASKGKIPATFSTTVSVNVK